MNKLLKTACMGMFATLFSALPLQAQSYYEDNCCPSECAPCYNYCDNCCSRFWGSAEYLFWKIQDSPEPVPLVIEGPVPSPFLNIDTPNTTVVLGGKKIKNDWDSGGRFGLGYWFDDCRTFGLEASYFILPYHQKKHSVAGVFSPDTFLGVPFFDTFNGEEVSFPITGPFPPPPAQPQATQSGQASLKLRNRMQSAELNGVLAMPTCSCNLKINLLGGFRWWSFDESLNFKTNVKIDQILTDISTTQDKFSAQNNFYGGQLGIALDYTCNCFFFNVKGKVALGANCTKFDIDGNYMTTRFNPGFPLSLAPAQTFEGGIFAQGTNIGSSKKTHFAVIPEVNADIGWQVNDCFRLKVGYTFLWANKVLRPGKQIDRNINPTQSVALTGNPNATLVGAPTPRAFNKTSSIWVQGISAGFDFSF